MSETKYTPGPWQIHKDKSGCEEMAVMAQSQGKLRCVAEMGDTSENECRANARLIAAAPDLLEALELAAMCPLHDFLTPEGMAQIRAAIAKAKGL